MQKLILILVVVLPNLVLAGTFSLGEYQTVSESEWNIRIKFEAQGKLTIYVESWLPGEYDNRDIKVMNGTWLIMNEHVLVKYNGISEKLKYFAQLSLESLGDEGALPGFVGSFDGNKGVLGGHPLWEVNALKKRYK